MFFLFKKKNKVKGAALVEVILSLALLVIIISIFSTVLIYGQDGSRISGDHLRATNLAREGIEAVRNIRDADFKQLVDGDYGLGVIGNQWDFSGQSERIGKFTRTITVSTISGDIKQVDSDISWDKGRQNQASIILSTYLSNWAIETGAFCSNQNTHLSVDTSSARFVAGGRFLRDIEVENTNIVCDILIAKMLIDWTNASGNLTEIRIGNTSVWSGSVASGTLVDIDDIALSNADGLISIEFRFEDRVNGETFNIDFEMEDGTTQNSGSFTP